MPKCPRVAHESGSSLGEGWIPNHAAGQHILMTDGSRIVTIPRHNPVNAITIGNIIRDAGLTVQELRELIG